MIKIYDSTEKEYATNGLGTVETYKCEEEKNISLNGWKITVECPLKYADLIVRDRIATAETKEKGMQPFRIGNVEKKGSRLYFTARHVAFDTENYVLANVRPTGLNPVAYANWLITHADQTMPFSVKGSAAGTCPTRDFVRKTVKDGLDQMLEDMPDVIIDPDKWDINVYDSSRVGSDHGRKITYGRNLQDWQITENWDDVCTKILPEGPNGLTMPEVYLISDMQYDVPYTKTVSFDIPDKDDAGGTYSDDQKIAMLRTQAQEYLKTHANPKVSYEIKSDIPQELCINDTVRVLHPMLTLTAHVQGYTYDCNSRRVLSVTFGNYDPSPASTLSGTVKDLKKRTEKVRSDQEKAIAIQTALIKNLSKNGYVYIDDNEIDVLDKLPRSSAKNVWRWTLGGLGFSSTGVDGTFTTAITQDGRINADFITTGVLSADLIKAGVLSDTKGLNTWNMDTGELHINTLSNLNASNLIQGTLDGWTWSGGVSSGQWESSNPACPETNGRGFMLPTNSDGSWRYSASKGFVLKNGMNYTLSYYNTAYNCDAVLFIRTDESDSKQWTHLLHEDSSNSGAWVKHVIKFKCAKTGTYFCIIGNKQISGLSAGNMALQGLKLEQGNLATGWTPHPEDMEAHVAITRSKDGSAALVAEAPNLYFNASDRITVNAGSKILYEDVDAIRFMTPRASSPSENYERGLTQFVKDVMGNADESTYIAGQNLRLYSQGGISSIYVDNIYVSTNYDSPRSYVKLKDYIKGVMNGTY
ncbi:MAG: hypothetical protein PUE04_00985 [Lachnospira sp.]|nr:hypothetical protein [Lachnospira sp.]